MKSVTLRVFDLLGKEVATLDDEKQRTGNCEVEFNASELTSGIYFSRLQVYPAKGGINTVNDSADKYVKTMKMILLK